MDKLKTTSDWFIEKCTNFLSSTLGFWIAFIVPLAVIPFPEAVKQIENILSSNWVQLWALFGMAIIAAKAAHHAKQAHEAVKKVHKHLGIEE